MYQLLSEHPLYKLIGHLTEDAMDERPMLTETFVDNAEELLTRVVEQIRDEVEQDIHILPSLKNKEIIKRCSSQGIFQIKSAVTSVAKILNISKKYGVSAFEVPGLIRKLFIHRTTGP